jgi:hypothetical protein
VVIGFKLLFAVLHKVSMQMQAQVGFVDRNRHNSLQHTYNIGHQLELEFSLRPTVSRAVRLGIGPPFGTLDQFLSYPFLSFL